MKTQVAMRVRTNRPIMAAAALGDRLHVEEPFVHVLRGFAIQKVLGNTASRHDRSSVGLLAGMLTRSLGGRLGKVQEAMAFFHRRSSVSWASMPS